MKNGSASDLQELKTLLASSLESVKTDALKERTLCNHCLGRLFAKAGHGFSNAERGQVLRDILGIEDGKCDVCGSLFDEVEKFAGLVVEALNEWEYGDFLMGSKIDAEIVEREEVLWSESGASLMELIKSEVNREVGKLVEKRTGKDVEFKTPDVVAILDTQFDMVEMQVSPLFIYGRYRKLVRGIPQTRWPCRECGGRGCDRCGGTGKMYQWSVEELVAKKVMDAAGGEEHAFHGMGREDIDVRMLGRGRPFVLEITRPRKRFLDLESLEKEINDFASGRVEISGFRGSDRNEVKRIKGTVYPKSYRALVEFNGPVDREKLKEVVNVFKGKTVSQQTPLRVVHRRADKIREKGILDLGAEQLGPRTVELRIKAESGTYIKELVHGDSGRTDPSISGFLGMGCEVKELDVLEIDTEYTADS